MYMDLNKARLFVNMRNNIPAMTQPIPINNRMNNQTIAQPQNNTRGYPIKVQVPEKEIIEVDLNYIINKKPDIKIVREYFKRSIQDFDESE